MKPKLFNILISATFLLCSLSLFASTGKRIENAINANKWNNKILGEVKFVGMLKTSINQELYNRCIVEMKEMIKKEGGWSIFKEGIDFKKSQSRFLKESCTFDSLVVDLVNGTTYTPGEMLFETHEIDDDGLSYLSCSTSKICDNSRNCNSDTQNSKTITLSCSHVPKEAAINGGILYGTNDNMTIEINYSELK